MIDNSCDWQLLVANLMISDNTLRNAAEKQFNFLRENQPETVLCGLLSLYSEKNSNSIPASSRALAAVLLRRILVQDQSMWPIISQSTQKFVKESLIKALLSESDESIRRRLCDTIGYLGAKLLLSSQQESEPPTGWPELMPTIFSCHRVIGPAITCRVLEKLAQVFAGEWTENENQTRHILSFILECITNNNETSLANKLAAARCFVMLLLHLSAEQLDNQLQSELCHLFKAIMTAIVGLVQYMVSINQYQSLVQLFDVLIELMDPHVSLYILDLETFKAFVNITVEIVSSNNIMDNPVDAQKISCQQLSMEFLVSLAEQAPTNVSRLLPKNEFARLTFPLTFELMLQVDATENQVQSEISNFDVGSEALERLVLAMGPKRSLSMCFELIQHYATQNTDQAYPIWVYHHTALVGICQIVGVIKRKKQPLYFDAVVSHVLNQFSKPEYTAMDAMSSSGHKKLICTALDVLGRLSVDQAPDFQSLYHQQTLEVIFKYLAVDVSSTSMNSFVHCQLHAARTLSLFIEKCPTEVLNSYHDGILTTIMSLISDRMQRKDINFDILEHAIPVLASVASTVDSQQFQPFASEVFALLINVLKKCINDSPPLAQTKDLKILTLAGITLETMSLISQALGKTQFNHFAKPLLEIMVCMQQTPEMSEEEVLRTYLIQAWSRLARLLKKDFHQFLPVLMPSLLQAASHQIQFDVDDSQLPNETEEDDDENLDDDEYDTSSTCSTDQSIDSNQSTMYDLAQVNGRCVSIRTSLLEEKITACEVLSVLVGECEEYFFPYAAQVTNILSPLIIDSVHKEIRSAAIEYVGFVVRCVAIAATPDNSNGVCYVVGKDDVASTLEYTLGKLSSAMTTEPESYLVLKLMSCIREAITCVRELHPQISLNEAQLHHLVQQLFFVLADSFQRRAERRGHDDMEDEGDLEDLTNSLTEGFVDEEDVAESDEDETDEQELQFEMANCLGHLAKTHGGLFYPVFKALIWEKVVTLSDQDCLASDRQLALYIIDDVLEHCGPSCVFSSQELSNFLELLLNALRISFDALSECRYKSNIADMDAINAEAAVIQSTVYGLGVLARLTDNLSHDDDKWEFQNTFVSLVVPQLMNGLKLFSHMSAMEKSSRRQKKITDKEDEDVDDSKPVWSARDNIVAALGLILEHQRMGWVDINAFHTTMDKYLHNLPLICDLEESVHVIQRLCHQITSGHEALLNISPNGTSSSNDTKLMDEFIYQRVSNVVRILADVLGQMSLFEKHVGGQVCSELIEKIKHALLYMRAQFPEDFMTRVWSELPSDLKRSMQMVFT